MAMSLQALTGAIKERFYARYPERDPLYKETRRKRLEALEKGFSEPPDIAQVRALIDQLEPDLRDALLMHVEDGMNYHQIAKALGITDPVALKRLVRAYSELRMRGLTGDLPQPGPRAEG